MGGQSRLHKLRPLRFYLPKRFPVWQRLEVRGLQPNRRNREGNSGSHRQLSGAVHLMEMMNLWGLALVNRLNDIQFMTVTHNLDSPDQPTGTALFDR
jgi:hypothetical protein